MGAIYSPRVYESLVSLGNQGIFFKYFLDVSVTIGFTFMGAKCARSFGEPVSGRKDAIDRAELEILFQYAKVRLDDRIVP